MPSDQRPNRFTQFFVKLPGAIAKRDWLLVLCFFILTRLVFHFIGIVGMTIASPEHSHHVGITLYAERPDLTWGKWDVSWYERIAREGYMGPNYEEDGYTVWAFMPLYPLVAGVAFKLLGGQSGFEFFYIASLLSNVASYLAILWIYRQFKVRLQHPDRLLTYLLIGCGTFYLSIPYTESVFLLLIAAVLHFTDRKQYLLAAFLAGLGLVSRIQGAALIALPFFTWWLIDRPRPVRGLAMSAGMGLLSAAPMLTFMYHLWTLTGDFFAFFTMQSAWNNPNPYPFKAVVGFFDAVRGVGPVMHLYLWVLYFFIIGRNARRLGPAAVLYCIGVFAVITSTEILYGANRYVLALVPALVVLADEKKWVRDLFVYSNLILVPLYAIGFVAWKDFVI